MTTKKELETALETVIEDNYYGCPMGVAGVCPICIYRAVKKPSIKPPTQVPCWKAYFLNQARKALLKEKKK